MLRHHVKNFQRCISRLRRIDWIFITNYNSTTIQYSFVPSRSVRAEGKSLVSVRGPVQFLSVCCQKEHVRCSQQVSNAQLLPRLKRPS